VGVFSPAPVRDRIAGPAVRHWGFARSLRADCHVKLLVPNADHPPGRGFEVVSHGNDRATVKRLVEDCQVVVVQGMVLAMFPEVADSDACIAVDLYDPFTLEALNVHASKPMPYRISANARDVDALLIQLLRGDFFVCGHERQRDFWLGMLSATKRLGPENADLDPTFRKLLDVVPFGLTEMSPNDGAPALKGVHPRIGPDDAVILWLGGIWDWFDPLTPIRAMAVLRQSTPKAKLVFLGCASPDPATPRMRMHRSAIRLAREMNLLDESVFFIDWVPYDHLPSYLLEANLGTYAHLGHLETHYSIRTRIFDYIAARLPMVLSAGDVMGDRVRESGVARTFPIGDHKAMAKELEGALWDEGLKRRLSPLFDPLIEEFSWSNSARALLDYCRAPWRAPDSVSQYRQATDATPPPRVGVPSWQLPLEAARYIQRNGLKGFGRAVADSMRYRGWIR
jgi:glycosyltransferase involved in cell wall biosynthesis